MRKKIKFLCIILIFVILSCSINRTIESNGDRKLKSLRRINHNNYIGISQNHKNFDEAWAKALSNAHSQIASDLGINIKVSTLDIYRVIEQHDFNTAISMINTKIKIDSEHNIKSKVTRFYFEKVVQMDDQVFNVWIEVFFDKEGFYANYQNFWNSEIVSLKTKSQKLDGDFMQNFHKLISLKNRFETEKVYLQNDTVNKFNSLFDEYNKIFNYQKQNISLQNTARKQKFSNEFIFKIYNKSTNEILSNFPIAINNKPFTSNAQGNIHYQANFQSPITAVIGYNTEKAFTIYQNNSFSPYDNKNISLRIRATDKILENCFQKIMTESGYKFTNDYDVMLEIIHKKNTLRVSVTQYITELKLEIVLSYNNKNLRTIHIPLDNNETINGFGKNENESVISAYSMEYYVQKKQAINLLEQSIRSELIISE